MKRKFVFFIVFVFLFFLFPQKILAITLSISNISSSIDKDQESEVDILLNCAGCGDSYIRGVFYPSGTNYFGFTQNNSGEWIGTETDRSKYFLIAKTDLVDASWSGKLKIKPDSNDSAYVGPGEYLFKVGRYTSSNDSSADWANELALRITGPTSTPTSSPTSTSTTAPTPVPTPTKTPTPVPAKTSTLKPTPSPQDTLQPEILGESTVLPTITPISDSRTSESSNKFPILAFVLIGVGIIFIGLSGFMVYKMRYNNLHGEENTS